MAIVGAQWVSHVAAAFNRGMTHPDRAPVPARRSPLASLQNGRLTGSIEHGELEGLATPLQHAAATRREHVPRGSRRCPTTTTSCRRCSTWGGRHYALLAAWCIARPIQRRRPRVARRHRRARVDPVVRGNAARPGRRRRDGRGPLLRGRGVATGRRAAGRSRPRAGGDRGRHRGRHEGSPWPCPSWSSPWA